MCIRDRYIHHTCHLTSFGSIFHFPTTLFHDCSVNVLPAHTGSTILKIGLTHFWRNISLFGPRNNPNRACFGHVFQPYRSAVQSFPLLSAPCPPSWTSKNVANMCISATGGFLGRLEPCIRHHFDDIFMYATLCWWHFDISDMILTALFTFWHHCFIIFSENHPTFSTATRPRARCGRLPKALR